jgi:hypothetical protein
LALATLAEIGVFQPWQLTVQQDQHQTPVTGLHRINEAALNAVDDEMFLKLRKSSALVIAYSQLISMQVIGVFQQLQTIQQQLMYKTTSAALAIGIVAVRGRQRHNYVQLRATGSASLGSCGDGEYRSGGPRADGRKTIACRISV